MRTCKGIAEGSGEEVRKERARKRTAKYSHVSLFPIRGHNKKHELPEEWQHLNLKNIHRGSVGMNCEGCMAWDVFIECLFDTFG